MLRTMNQEQALRKEIEFDKYMNDEIKKVDCKIIDELDQCRSDQVKTLENANVPHFFYTDKQIEIKLQMYILDFILRIQSTRDTWARLPYFTHVTENKKSNYSRIWWILINFDLYLIE